VNKDVSWIFFGDWHNEVTNVTSSMFFEDLLDYDDDIVSVRQLEPCLKKFYMNISKTSSSANYTVRLRQFEILEWKTAKGDMEGVNTPIFIAPKTPDVPQTGLIAALYSAIKSIGDMFMSAMKYMGDTIMTLIDQYIPNWSVFWSQLIEIPKFLVQYFTFIWDNLLAFLNVLYEYVGFLTYPIRLVGDSYTWLKTIWGEFWGTHANPVEIGKVMFFIVFALWIFSAVAEGDWSGILKVTKLVWGVANALIEFTMKAISFMLQIIQQVISAIRG